MDQASSTPAGVSEAAHAHWKVSVTGERQGQGIDRRARDKSPARRCRVVAF
jgi:hypothetical protein